MTRGSGTSWRVALLSLALMAGSALGQSIKPGMGAVPYSGGTTFRVWAPNATAVAVAGNFNAWSASANPLVSEGNGHWSADVTGVGEGNEYKFVITNGTALWKNDPRAREIYLGHRFTL